MATSSKSMLSPSLEIERDSSDDDSDADRTVLLVLVADPERDTGQIGGEGNACRAVSVS
eukprot:CAMPEP_0181062122 /NCGR_PEP_ID=MMETSP1070-20121207/22901_1 /TAXON_ID=265543 /ORGANISM="Minutocellus polymorphus, Strain NH13" /LENGTH=58 /DNA_ID=CAMNT_0023142153 /DNA_START=90 /DNA_END=266 /DNA_ORIENTATION=-